MFPILAPRSRAACSLAVAAALISASAASASHLRVTDETTRTECGACHMAYAPQFLPARSWKQIMATLDNHFGEDASLDPDVAAKIEAYLTSHAADTGGNLPAALSGVSPSETPLRISEMPWFTRRHAYEVSRRWLQKAGSWSNCTYCHRGAEQGYFEDD
ncbi:MAG: cytochrome C [Alphaproteobacteria bacterium]|nr:MAG: cytochrome C [Alphaproteobacteria bacterium]